MDGITKNFDNNSVNHNFWMCLKKKKKKDSWAPLTKTVLRSLRCALESTFEADSLGNSG